MPGLKFLIEGDDRKLRKTLKDLARDMDKDLTKAAGGLAVEVDKGSKATKEHIKLVEKEERAYKKRNETAAKLPTPKRPIDMGNSAAEVAAYQSSKSGNIAGGTVVGQGAAYGAIANQATAASVATSKLTTETVKQTAATKAQGIALEDMKRRLLVFTELQQAATDPVQRAKYNRQVQQTSIEIKKMENAGKQGFDAMGNAVKGSTNLFSKAITGIMRMAYLLPGIGVAGLLAFAIDPIVNFISKLGIANDKITAAVASRKALAQVQLQGSQNAQAELVNLRLLTAQYNNTNLPLRQRKEAYSELQKQYPAYFANISFESAAAGKAKEAYDRLTQSIIASAKARAFSEKIAENSSRILSDEERMAELREKQLKAREEEARAKAKLDLNSGVADISSGRQDKYVRAYLAAQAKREAFDREINNLATDRAILNERNLKLEEKINKEVEKGGKIAGSVGAIDKVATDKSADNIKAARKKLADELKLIPLDTSLSNEESTKKQISAQQEFLKALVENGVDPAGKAVQEVTDKIFALKQALFAIEGNAFAASIFSSKSAANARDAAAELERQAKALEALSDLPDPFPEDNYDEYAEKLEDVKDSAYMVSDALSSWSSELNGVNDGLSKVLMGLSNTANQVGNIANTMKSMKGASALNQALGAAGMLGAAVGIVKTLSSFFDNSEELQRQQLYSQDQQLKAIDAQTKAMERQLALIKDLYGSERLEKFGASLDDIKKKFEDQGKAITGKRLLTDNVKQNVEIERVNNGQKSIVADEINKMVARGEIKTVGSIIPPLEDILKSSEALEKLQGLLDGGKLDATTATQAQSLITLAKQYRDTLNEIRAETTGTTFSGIADSIVEMFARGNASAEEFGKNFEEIMKKSILASFKRNALEKELQSFYEKFAEYSGKDSGGVLDDKEIENLRTQYNQIIADSQKKFDDLQKTTGIGFGADSGSSSNSMVGGIKREITEETGSLIAGQFNGLRLLSIQGNSLLTEGNNLKRQSLDIAMSGIRHLQAIEANTFRTANNTDLLKSIDAKLSNPGNTLAANGIKP